MVSLFYTRWRYTLFDIWKPLPLPERRVMGYVTTFLPTFRYVVTARTTVSFQPFSFLQNANIFVTKTSRKLFQINFPFPPPWKSQLKLFHAATRGSVVLTNLTHFVPTHWKQISYAHTRWASHCTPLDRVCLRGIVWYVEDPIPGVDPVKKIAPVELRKAHVS